MARWAGFKPHFAALQQFIMTAIADCDRAPHLAAMPASLASSAPKKDLGFPEFVCLIALMMALNALAIDSMLPALPHIGADLGVANENSRQWVVTAYLLGFGGAQLIYGPLADRFGLPLDPYPRLNAIRAACEALPAFAEAHPARQPDAV